MTSVPSPEDKPAALLVSPEGVATLGPGATLYQIGNSYALVQDRQIVSLFAGPSFRVDHLVTSGTIPPDVKPLKGLRVTGLDEPQVRVPQSEKARIWEEGYTTALRTSMDLFEKKPKPRP